MHKSLYHFHPEVSKALRTHQPVIALESTIITHGIPYPENLEFAKQAEGMARSLGAVLIRSG